MAINFPTSLDTFPSAATLASQTLATTPHSTLHGDLGAALAAVEAKLGVDDSAVTTSLDYQTNRPQAPSGRLTLTTAVPVTTSDVTGASTVYFTPYQGNSVALYNTTATKWFRYTFAEISASLSGLTANIPTDVFGYWTGSAVALELVNWTNGTTRATALTTQDGVRVKSGDATRLYLGTVCGSGSGTCEDSAAKRLVHNYYNQVWRRVVAMESTPSWTYTTQAYRPINNNTANRIQLVSGTGEGMADLLCVGTSNSSVGGTVFSGIGADSTTGNNSNFQTSFSLANVTLSAFAGARVQVPVGYHYYQGLEYGGGSGTQTWYGSGQTAGILGSWWA